MDEISRGTQHTLSSLDEVRPHRISETLDSVLDLMFLLQALRSNQSSINSSFSNQDVDPSKRRGIFVVIPPPAVYTLVGSARCAQTIDSAGFSLFFKWESHQDLPHGHSSLTLLKFSSNTHSRGISCTTRSSTFNKTKAPLRLCGCEYVLSVWTVRDGIQ